MSDVRELLLDEWGKQACRNPADWPGVLRALMRDGGGPDVNKRCSMAPAVDLAVERLTALFEGAPPANPGLAVRRAFWKLDRAHAEALARRILAAEHEPPGESAGCLALFMAVRDHPAALHASTGTDGLRDRGGGRRQARRSS